MKYFSNIKWKTAYYHPPIWVLFFGLIGFALRLQRLDFQPLWGDEGWSFYLALQPLPKLMALTAIDIHPPFYYLLLKGWLGLVGVGAEEARLLSVGVGTLLIPALYVLGCRLFNRRVGVASAAVVALMPLAIYYSQEVRMYGLVTLLGAWSVYFFVRLPLLEKPVQTSAIPEKAERSSPPQSPPKGGKFYPLSLGERVGVRGLFYILTTTAALYTHYYAGFIVLFQGITALGYLFRHLSGSGWSLTAPDVARSGGQPKRLRNYLSQTKRKQWLTLFSPFLTVGLLFLPWLIYLGSNLTRYIENKRDVEGYVPKGFVQFLTEHFIAFSLGHLPSEWSPYLGATLPFIVLAILGLLALYNLGRLPLAYHLLSYLLIPILIGYGINLIFPFNPRYYERTLLLAGPAYWLFLGAGLVWVWQRQKLLHGVVVIVLLLFTFVSLLSFYNTPRYPHQDYRPLLQDIAAIAVPEDTILASYQWQLGFYQAYLPEPRPQLFTVPNWGQGWAEEAGEPQRRSDVEKILGQSERLWFPAYQAAGHIWEDEAEATIAKIGYPTQLKWYSPETKVTLTGAAPAEVMPGPQANFANKLLLVASEIGIGPYQAGRGVIPIKLTWQKADSLGNAHRVNLRMVDATGRIWASRDSHPQGGQAFFTNLQRDDLLPDRHGLLLTAGMPPGTYRLLLSIRQVADNHPLDLLDPQGQPLGADLLLAEITVTDPDPPLSPLALPVQVRTEAHFADRVRLEGYSLGHGPFEAGRSLPLSLFWQSLTDRQSPLTVSIQLMDEAGQLVVDYQQAPLRDPTTWRQGTLLHDLHEVPLPAKLIPGQYQLKLGLRTPEQTLLAVNGYEQFLLTTLETSDRPHIYEPPTPQLELAADFNGQAQLIGVDLPHTEVTAGDELPVTLYWHSVEPFARSWTVFVHLIDAEGQIISQQDHIPGGGAFPTPGWLPGEYLTDQHLLQIPSDLTSDQPYQLRVGLYDANDFSRLPLIENGEIVGDHLILENQEILVQ